MREDEQPQGHALATTLLEVIQEAEMPDDLGADYRVEQVRTFEEVGMLTTNAGLLFRMADGSEFTAEIVRYR